MDSGPGSLRDAITRVNDDAHSATDSILFHIDHSVQTIVLESPLPPITHAVIVDGTTQPGFAGSPIIVLDGRNVGIGLDILGGGSTVKGLVIQSCQAIAIALEQNGGDTVEGNYIGIDVTGTNAVGNGTGVDIEAGAGVGTIIGGIGASKRNVISGNFGNGIVVFNGFGVLIEGNYIGTDASGTHALGNGNGVDIQGNDNTIGGTVKRASNLISGNGIGVLLPGNSTGNLVQGNLIGTDATGTKPLANLDGVFVSSGAFNNTIGGVVAGSGNVIAASVNYGVALFLGASGNFVQGNKIGTDVTGMIALGNQTGVFIGEESNNNTIGGTQSGASNIISGSPLDGIYVTSSSGNLIQGNLIGTDISGAHALGNRNGLLFIASGNTIGGIAGGAGNLISGNLADGIALPDDSSSNVIQGNKIGTTITGQGALANAGAGVSIDGSLNVIGGAELGAGNVIAFNGGDGVFVDSGFRNLISRNSIFSNGGLGIDLNVAFNANNSQPAPVLTSAVTAQGIVTVTGTLTSTPDTTFTIELFASIEGDPSGFGEGKTFLGWVIVTTDDNGVATFTFSFSFNAGQFITATATDPNNNTSEFSAYLQV